MSDYANDPDKRSDFLLKVYETYNKEIERHFGLAWQAVSVFLASLLAIASAITKVAGIPGYIVICLYLLLVTWAIEVVVDATFWYNRNLVVITNIERQFLKESDARDIQWYFQNHRKFNKPITFMRSLLLFLVTIALVVLGFYFALPNVNGQADFFAHATSYLPIIFAIGLIFVLRRFAQSKNAEYQEFKTNAPGIDRGQIQFIAPEHDLSKRNETRFNKILSFIEDALLSGIGIEVSDKPLISKKAARGFAWAALIAVVLAGIGYLFWSASVYAPYSIENCNLQQSAPTVFSATLRNSTARDILSFTYDVGIQPQSGPFVNILVQARSNFKIPAHSTARLLVQLPFSQTRVPMSKVDCAPESATFSDKSTWQKGWHI